MCGIAGVFLPRHGTRVDANLEKMLAAQRHRGPDGDSRYVSDDRGYQVCFSRLAIIDLDTGEQPIVGADGASVLTGNGEIYNYREIRRAFPDYPYRTRGDMESIFPLVGTYGKKFIDHLNGMFAIALYKGKSHRLTLVRDRLGIKPLYWAELAGGGIIFASEIKTLFASGLMRPQVDEGAVSSYLAHGYVPAPNTLFRGVHKLAAGHRLEIDAAGKITIEQYWDAHPAAGLPDDPEDIEAYLVDLLRESVDLQLRSDVPLGILLSGGIDSGLIVALAAERSRQPVNTYTVSFEGASVDEAPLAALVAERYGTNHTKFDLPADRIMDCLPKLAWHSDDLVNDAALLPNYLIEEVLGEHVKVALNGTGGDELFAGYGRYFQLPIERRYLGAPRPIRSMIEVAVGTVSPMRAWQLARAEKFDGNRGQYLHDHSTYFPAPIRRLMGNSQERPSSAQGKFFANFAGPAETGALYADIKTYLAEDLLTLLDRTSMAASVEGRVPFLDHRLVEAALAVSPTMRTQGGRPKALARRMAGKFLPDVILNAPKQGFASPVPAWIRAGLGDMAHRILIRPEALARGWWSAQGIKRLASDPERHGFRLYSLLMLELTVRIHVEGSFDSAPTEGLEAFAT